MDETGIEAAGLQPIALEFARIAAIRTRADLARVLGEEHEWPGDLLPTIHAGIEPDHRDPRRMIVRLRAGGLTLPAGHYRNPQPAEIRAQHRRHVARMLALAGLAAPEEKAARIQALEAAIARGQKPGRGRPDLDVPPPHEPTPVAQLARRHPGVDWTAFLEGAGVGGETAVDVPFPAEVTAIARAVRDVSLDAWKDYLTYRLLEAAAPYLPRSVVEEDFAFYGKTLEGRAVLAPRGERGALDTAAALDFALGRLYVERFVDPGAKAAVGAMAADLVAALDARLSRLPWMSPPARAAARAKLARTTWKIGYPDRWPTHEGLDVVRGEALGNARRAARFRRAAAIARLETPVDRAAWTGAFSTAPAVAADPARNEIVVAVSMLQPPFFDRSADPAVQYGGLGALVAHELTHLLDALGRQYDGDGRRRDWWSADDAGRFEALTDRLAAQVSTDEVLPGRFVDGQATLFESVPDLGAVAIAYDGYRRSLEGADPPVLDGFTGDQRFFLAWAQLFRSKLDDLALVRVLETGARLPESARPRVVRNHDAWYAAFDVRPGEKLYLAPGDRLTIW
jgi:putative endopeptidase